MHNLAKINMTRRAPLAYPVHRTETRERMTPARVFPSFFSRHMGNEYVTFREMYRRNETRLGAWVQRAFVRVLYSDPGDISPRPGRSPPAVSHRTCARVRAILLFVIPRPLFNFTLGIINQIIPVNTHTHARARLVVRVRVYLSAVHLTSKSVDKQRYRFQFTQNTRECPPLAGGDID